MAVCRSGLSDLCFPSVCSYVVVQQSGTFQGWQEISSVPAIFVEKMDVSAAAETAEK